MQKIILVSSCAGGEPVARSQAKQLLQDAGDATAVVFDFAGIAWVGQGFADEALRVWPQHHPGVTVSAINVGEDVRRMIRRVRREVGLEDIV